MNSFVPTWKFYPVLFGFPPSRLGRGRVSEWPCGAEILAGLNNYNDKKSDKNQFLKLYSYI